MPKKRYIKSIRYDTKSLKFRTDFFNSIRKETKNFNLTESEITRALWLTLTDKRHYTAVFNRVINLIKKKT